MGSIDGYVFTTISSDTANKQLSISASRRKTIINTQDLDTIIPDIPISQ